jgi:hypothetical protein
VKSNANGVPQDDRPPSAPCLRNPFRVDGSV